MYLIFINNPLKCLFACTLLFWDYSSLLLRIKQRRYTFAFTEICFYFKRKAVKTMSENCECLEMSCWLKGWQLRERDVRDYHSCKLLNHKCLKRKPHMTPASNSAVTVSEWWPFHHRAQLLTRKTKWKWLFLLIIFLRQDLCSPTGPR